MASAPTPRADCFNLYLKDVPATKGQDATKSIATRKQQLKDVETHFRKVLVSSPSMQKELRMHFTGTLSAWENVPVEGRLRLLGFLKTDPRSRFSQKLMQLVCARKAADVARILSADDRLFRRFFGHSPERIKGWFSHFSFPGPFEKGALAIERYAMTHRDEFWNRMIWLYSTAPSPVVIVHQKIRFLELDVVRTVEMMADSEPAFWSSEYFRNSLVGGDFLAIDPAFFADELCRRIDSSEVYALTEAALREEPFRELCNRVLLELDDASMLHLLYRLVPASSATFEQLFVTQPKWVDMEEALLFTALLTQSKAVMKSLSDERPEDHRALLTIVASFMPRTEEACVLDLAVQYTMEHVALTEGALAYAKLVILVSFVLRVALVSFFADRSSLQTIYRQENLNAELVFEQPLQRTEGHSRDKKKKKKKRGRDDEEEPIFIGWRFPGVALAFGVRDACQTVLPELFLRRAAAQFAKR